MPGRIYADTASRVLVAGDVALGAGWGGAATFAILTRSNDQRGQIAITASTTTPSQATSTVTITFAQAWEYAPFAFVVEAANTQVTAEEGVVDIATTTTTLIWLAGILPVDTKVYTYNWWVVG
jgi:hypothetical protein